MKKEKQMKRWKTNAKRKYKKTYPWRRAAILRHGLLTHGAGPCTCATYIIITHGAGLLTCATAKVGPIWQAGAREPFPYLDPKFLSPNPAAVTPRRRRRLHLPASSSSPPASSPPPPPRRRPYAAAVVSASRPLFSPRPPPARGASLLLLASKGV